jgi:hypothetical protein
VLGEIDGSVSLLASRDLAPQEPGVHYIICMYVCVCVWGGGGVYSSWCIVSLQPQRPVCMHTLHNVCVCVCARARVHIRMHVFERLCIEAERAQLLARDVDVVGTCRLACHA